MILWGPMPASPRTVAIVPGAFKPPHLGHADMVRKYAAMADEVIVLISKASSKRAVVAQRSRVITAEDSLKIWELLTKDIPNVTIGVYNDPADSLSHECGIRFGGEARGTRGGC